MSDEIDGPLEPLEQAMAPHRSAYDRDVLQSRPFQEGLQYLHAIALDFLVAHSAVRMQAYWYGAEDRYLLFRFAQSEYQLPSGA